MDHAKALADALFAIASFMDRVGKPGNAPPAIRATVEQEVKMVLNAQGIIASKSAEASTRENSGPLVQKFLLSTHQQQGKCFECGSDLQAPICPKCNPEFDISRPHQQQGSESELVKELRDLASYQARSTFEDRAKAAMTKAADALSRAQQPDTVTELVKRDCLYEPCSYPTCKCVGVGIDARELTAALAARGKAG